VILQPSSIPPSTQFKETINFSPKFTTPPKILTSISSIFIDGEENYQIDIVVENIKDISFDLIINYLSTYLIKISINWLAIDSNAPYRYEIIKY
jgi:hypothetical protein